jgi:hypothetical protein
MRRRGLTILTAGLAAIAAAGCAEDYYGERYGGGPVHGPDGYAYDGRAWAGERRPFAGDLHGPGIALLDPWLKETAEGRAVVTLGFRETAEGFVSEEIAHRANIWFRRYADENRDMRITDPEIRTALVAAAGAYLR